MIFAEAKNKKQYKFHYWGMAHYKYIATLKKKTMTTDMLTLQGN